MRNLPFEFNLLGFFMPQNIVVLGLQFAFHTMCFLGHVSTKSFQSLQIFLRGLHTFLHPTREVFQRAFNL